MIRAALTGLALTVATSLVACAPASPPVTAAYPGPVPAGSGPAHTVVVMLENKDAGDVSQQAPYLSSLAASGVRLGDMHAETHPSQPNYLALFSGDTHGVPDDRCPVSFTEPNLAGELTAAGLTFAGYSEDLPAPGYTGCRSGGYARKHNPWVDFTNLPASANLPLSAMPSNYADLPTVSFVVPNLCHDMHDCSVAVGDTWLRQNIDGYAQWARTHDSLLVVTFDESEGNDADNHIATFAVGEKVVPGTLAERADHYRLLRTIEDLYRLPALGHSANTARIADLWRAPM